MLPYTTITKSFQKHDFRKSIKMNIIITDYIKVKYFQK